MRFCSAGTTASPTSTARSPRATMMQSEASSISSSAGIASARSIFATVSARPPALCMRSRAQRMSSPERGKDTPRKSALSAAAVLMSCMSFSVSAGAVRPPPLRLMPLLLESGPPCSTTVVMRGSLDRGDAEHDAAVVEQQRIARAHVVGQIAVVEPDLVLIAERALGVEHELRPRREVDLSVAEAPDADLRALQIHQHADGAARLARELAHQLDALAVLVGRAVREIHAHYVEPGRDHARENLRDRSRRGRAWRRSWCGEVCRSSGCPVGGWRSSVRA